MPTAGRASMAAAFQVCDLVYIGNPTLQKQIIPIFAPINTDTDMSDIFISYRRDGGADRAHLIYNILNEAGYDVFMDIHGLNNGKFPQALEKNVKSCKDFVLILSKHMFQDEREEDYVLKEIDIAVSEGKNFILLSPEKDFWTNEKPPKEVPDLDKMNYCYLPDNDQVATILLSRDFISKKKRPISYQSSKHNLNIEIKVCDLFDQEGIRVIHCVDDFETSPRYIKDDSVFGQFLQNNRGKKSQINDEIAKQLEEKTSDGSYDFPSRRTKYYHIGTTLHYSIDCDEYRIVAFNHWDKDGHILPYTIEDYRSFLRCLWENLSREGKSSIINITLMGNNFTRFRATQPNTEHKIWIILESVFDAVHDWGFQCDKLRICIHENDVEQIRFTDLKSIIRYLDERQQ